MTKNKLNISLLKQALRIKQSNTRQATSHVKTRGEVSGGGKKPWRQKGTGRARAGSSRSPIWIGGGVVFGPSKERHYKLHLPKKMNRAAIDQYLNHLQSEDKVIIVDSLHIKEPKTKLAVKLLKDNQVDGKKVLLITAKLQAELLAGTSNLQGVTVVEATNPSLTDLIGIHVVLIEKDAAKTLGLEVKEVKATAKKVTKAPTKKTASTTKK